MSTGVRVTNERAPRRFTEGESTEGVVDDEDVDWDPTNGGTAELDQWKQPVRAATTGPVTIATALNAGDTIDGVTLVAGDRVLVKDQTAPEENGIWVVGPTPERAVDLDSDDEVLGAVAYVVAGATNGSTAWAVTNDAPTVVDTDPIDWAEFGGGGTPTLALDDLTDVAITSPAPGDRLRFDGSVWANSSLRWSPIGVNAPTLVTTDGLAVWTVLTTSTGDPVLAEVP